MNPQDIIEFCAERSDSVLVAPLRRDGDSAVIQEFNNGIPDRPAIWVKSGFPARRATGAECRRAFPGGQPVYS